MSDAESMSAAMRRVEQERDWANELCDTVAAELRLVTRERDSLARRCAVRFEERDLARAELASARQELDAVRTARDNLDRDLAEARATIRALTRTEGEPMITEDEARMIGRAIREEAKLIALPIENEFERRTICLKLAIETKGVAFSLKNDGSVAESADQVLEAARMYDDFVSGKDLNGGTGG